MKVWVLGGLWQATAFGQVDPTSIATRRTYDRSMHGRSAHLAPLFVLALLLAALLTACTGGSDGTATATASPTAEPTEVPTAAPTAPPTLTSTPTPTPTPTPEPTPTPIPAVKPSATAGGASFLWSGSVANPGIPWTAMRITVGADPLVDPWEFELGAISRTQFQCQPSAVEGGITLGGCGRVFSATVDFEAVEMTVAFNEPTAFGERWVESLLSPVWQRDEPPNSDNVALLWEHRAEDATGSSTDVWAADGVVFAPHFGGLIELLDAASGERIGRIDAPSSVLDVKARDGVLYAATTASGLVIYDVSDPTAPFFLGQYAVRVGAGVELVGNVHNIYLSPSRDLVFAINVTHPQTDLRLIDVSDPTAPFEAGRFVITEAASTLEGAHDVHVVTRGDREIAFLNVLSQGFLILDVTDPAAIEVLSRTVPDGTFSHSGWIGDLAGRTLYLHGDEGADQRLTLYDVSSLEAPELLADFATRPGLSVHNIEVDGATAYVSYYVDGLRVFDLSDPGAPREVAHFDTVAAADERDILQGAWGVHVDDGVVYISDRESGIFALQVELP